MTTPERVVIGDAELWLGDSMDVLPLLDPVSAVVCDPPYGLKFMGKRWDYDVPSTDLWALVLDRLLPGGHLLAFAGTRTQHRMAVRIEDAGFEIRDMLAWVYGSGFPKSLDVGKAIDKAAGAVREVVGPRVYADGHVQNNGGSGRDDIKQPFGGGFSLVKTGGTYMDTQPSTEAARQWDGWGTALKPAFEPVTMARKPLISTVAENVQAHGTGALNIDGCRVESGGEHMVKGVATRQTTVSGDTREGAALGMYGAGASFTPTNHEGGRWPANFAHDGSDEVLALFPETSSGAGQPLGDRGNGGIWAAGNGVPCGPQYGDAGSAARFFKTAEYTEEELLFSRAKAMLSAWHSELANTADSSSTLSNEAAAFVLSGAATWALPEGRQLSVSPTLSTSVTPTELRRISESSIVAILSSANGCSPEWQRARPIPNGCHVQCAETQGPTGIITITISHWKLNGSAAPVTFSITPTNLEHGAVGLASDRRFHYCAKAAKSERGEGNDHPTVKPLALMRWLLTLVVPPGGIVLDPFLGSGSTGVAAVGLGMRFIGVERDRKSFDIACSRIESAQRQTNMGLA